MATRTKTSSSKSRSGRSTSRSTSKPATSSRAGSTRTGSSRSSHRRSSTTSHSTTPPSRRWSAKVKTDSTKPAPGLFKKSAQEIAKGMTRKSVAPEGPAQAMQMLSFYENRAGKNLSGERKRTLEKAKDIVRSKEGKGTTKSSSGRTRKSASSRRPSTKSHTRTSSSRKAR